MFAMYLSVLLLWILTGWLSYTRAQREGSLARLESRPDCRVHRLVGGHHLHLGEAAAVARSEFLRRRDVVRNVTIPRASRGHS